MTAVATAGGEPELVFALPAGANVFFVELAEALCYELDRLGASARVALGELPEPSPERVQVLLPPHEFVVLTGFRPTPSVLRRCILISAEQPTSTFFDGNVKLARSAGAVFDINARAVRAYRGNGIDATHIQLGYTELWDGDRLAHERDIDVVFMGRFSERRADALSLYSDVLERFKCHFVISDNSQPNIGSGPNFLIGEEKRRLLARAKVLLNIHGDDEPYFEWLRVAEAICAGCVVVTEHSTDLEPLIAGQHLVSGRLETLGLLAAAVVDDDSIRAKLSEAAYARLRSEAPLSIAAERLRAAAIRVAAVPVEQEAAQAAWVGGVRAKVNRREPTLRQPHKVNYATRGEGASLRALKQVLQQLTAIRRDLAAQALASRRRSDPAPHTVREHVSPGWSLGAPPSVSVVIPLYNQADLVRDALDSVLSSQRTDWEILVVDDGSTDGSGDVVRAFIDAHPYRRCLLLRHEVNRGLAPARNTGAEYARADRLLMLDSDNTIGAHAIGRLIDALEADPTASFAYGILARFTDAGPAGLLSLFGWDPARLRTANYIDALALIRREALIAMRGYTSDPRLMGWEDYDLWVRLAEAGCHGAFVPEIVAHYRAGHGSMISTTNLSVTDAYGALVEHAPKLMHGLEIPGL